MNNNNLPNNWLKLFDTSFQQVKNNNLSKPYPSAVRLSTVSKSGLPSVRVVLLKSYDEKGFVIYTNMNSRKGQELQQNPFVALYFYWPEINQEISIEGKVEMISDAESDAYFQSRLFFSKVGAHASKQSNFLSHRIFFMFRVLFFTLKYFLKKEVDRPSYWRGFRVVPEKIKFIKNF